MRWFLTTTITLLAATFALSSLGGAKVSYPSQYRSWQHVKSALILPGHPLDKTFGGIHHIYANSEAMNGLTNGVYAEGAVFVFDLLSYVENNHTIEEGARKRIDVMQFNESVFTETGGWGYESFADGERIEQDVTQACYSCHLGKKSSGFVFSEYRP